MKSFRDMKISTKLIAIFSVLSIISGLVGYFINTNSDNILVSIITILFLNIIMSVVFLAFISGSINKPLEEAQNVLGKMAINDFTSEMNGYYTGTMKELSKNVNGLRDRLLSIQDAFVRISRGDSSRLEEFSKVGKRSENDQILPALIAAMKAVQNLINEVEELSKATIDGNLNIRGDINKFEGGYRTAVEGFNNALDAVVKPLTDSMNVMEKFALNDFTLNMSNEYNGFFSKFAAEINDVQERLLSVQSIAAKVSKGDLSELDSFKKIGKRSENDQLIPAFTNMMETIKNLILEVESLTNASLNGDLSFRGNSNKFEGGYSSIIESFNSTLDAIIEPVQEAAAVLDEMSKGNLQVSVKGNYKGDHAKIKNALNDSINILSSYVSEISNTLTHIANGNLDIGITVDYRGDFAEIKDSLNDIIRALNDVMNNINNSAVQVASGSRQVSDSAQALSQGSTEQASSIEELTASIEEIAAQTKQNAANADQANELALMAKGDAVNGNEQMKEMLKAMGDINESSANISKIIKVIDEIAFQTNILALNAAVEAARAGQHGKGFAVVAEEVRNLAARSANAAKETTVLIESSINKAAGGTKIANDTAQALNKIVEGVAKAASLVGEIAAASNEQAAAIAQINQGIMQVSEVTQINSATSEESAAASEELSSQAELLKEMVSKFKLKKESSKISNLNELNPEVLKMLEKMAENQKSKSSFGNNAYAEAAVTKSKIALSDREFGKY